MHKTTVLVRNIRQVDDCSAAWGILLANCTANKSGHSYKSPCEEGDCANELKTGQASEDVLTWERLQVPCYNLHNNSHARSFLHW